MLRLIAKAILEALNEFLLSLHHQLDDKERDK